MNNENMLLKITVHAITPVQYEPIKFSYFMHVSHIIIICDIQWYYKWCVMRAHATNVLFFLLVSHLSQSIFVSLNWQNGHQ